MLSSLVRFGLVSERDRAEACAAKLNLPLRSAKDVLELSREDAVLGQLRLSLKFMTQFHAVAVAADADSVDVLLEGLQEDFTAGSGALATGREPRLLRGEWGSSAAAANVSPRPH